MNEIVRWKKADDLKKKITAAKSQLDALESDLSSLRKEKVFCDGLTFSVLGTGKIDKLTVNEIWLNDYVYLDATGFHNTAEKEK